MVKLVNGELQNYEAAMLGFGPALGDDEIASILSYARSAWTDAPADITSGFVKKAAVRKDWPLQSRGFVETTTPALEAVRVGLGC